MLTNETAYDKVVKSPTRMTKLHLQKKFEKLQKKFLTNKRRCGKVNKLSRDSEKQRTLITKQ